MTITDQNAEIYRGDSAILAVDLTDANDDPFVLSANGTIKYCLSLEPYAAQENALILKELNAGIILDGSTAEITLDEADTDLAPGLYYHELKVYDGGDVATAMTGNIVVRHALKLMGRQQSADATIHVGVGVAADGTKV